MTPIFADTYFFIAFLVKSDAAHQKARSVLENLTSPLLTSTWVLMELGDALTLPGKRDRLADFFKFLKEHPLVTVLPPSQFQFDGAVELFDQRPDKSWSLTDCTSFIIMSQQNISHALTADHHFEQAGFQALLK